jgi:hypothetical protein
LFQKFKIIRREGAGDGKRKKFDGVEVNENIDLKSTNSSIKGRIIGLMTEFNIISKTINGKNNLPSSLKLGDKNLTAVTSNGSINIEFGGRTLK